MFCLLFVCCFFPPAVTDWSTFWSRVTVFLLLLIRLLFAIGAMRRFVDLFIFADAARWPTKMETVLLSFFKSCILCTVFRSYTPCSLSSAASRRRLMVEHNQLILACVIVYASCCACSLLGYWVLPFRLLDSVFWPETYIKPYFDAHIFLVFLCFLVFVFLVTGKSCF